MAMTKCKECGKDISTTAVACPNCGAKPVRTSGCAQLVAGGFLLLALLFVIGTCSRESNPSRSPTGSNAAARSPTRDAAAPPPTLPVNGAQWTYDAEPDPMGKGGTYYAVVKSSNTVEFEFPYAGPQRGTLTLRKHPRHGKDVIFQIERGQLLCRSYDGCSVLVRFDDGQAQKFAAGGASDNSTEVLFIRDYARFVKSMSKAKTVRIAPEVFRQGQPVFEFDVSGFDPKLYEPSAKAATSN